MGKSGMHTIVLPLKANARDLQIVSESLSIVGKLRNAALGEMLQRIDNMRSDTRWDEAGRGKGFGLLHSLVVREAYVRP